MTGLLYWEDRSGRISLLLTLGGVCWWGRGVGVDGSRRVEGICHRLAAAGGPEVRAGCSTSWSRKTRQVFCRDPGDIYPGQPWNAILHTSSPHLGVIVVKPTFGPSHRGPELCCVMIIANLSCRKGGKAGFVGFFSIRGGNGKEAHEAWCQCRYKISPPDRMCLGATLFGQTTLRSNRWLDI